MPDHTEETATTARYILLRMVVTALLLAIALVGLTERPWMLLTGQVLFHLAAVTFLVMGLSALAVRVIGSPRWFVFLQLGFDGLLVTALSFLTGGLESPFFVLYTINIMATPWLVPRGAYGVAAYDIFLFALVFGGQLFLFQEGPVLADRGQLYTQLLLKILALGIVGGLAAELSKQMHRTKQELSEQIAARETLATEHALLLDQVQTGVLMVDDKGHIASQNPALNRMLGDVVGLRLSEVLHGDGPRWEQVHASGADRRHLLCSRSFVDGGAQMVVVEDVTRLRTIEQEMALRERMAAVGRLAAGLAHEIRNPLASLSGSVQLLGETGQGPLYEIILREIERLNVLVDDFLDIARPLSLSRTEVSFGDLVSEVVKAFRNDPRFQATVRVEADVPASQLAPVWIDPLRMRQVVWNLVINAAQALAEGGVVTVGLSGNADRVDLWVSDDGPGIASERLPHIFDPFYTTKAGGTGLGLANVQRIVKAHGGEVVVDSRVGRGTTFRVRLPDCYIPADSTAEVALGG